MSKNTWIIEVKAAHHCEPLWVGNITADSRQEAKKAATAFVGRHFDESAKILRIARGYMTIQFFEPPSSFED